MHGFLLALLVLLAWIRRDRPLYVRLTEEDAWVEWATFLAFAFAGGVAAWGAARCRGICRVGEAVALVGLALFCLFVAGEEISWAQRLLGYRPAEIFLERNYQQEANFHNFLQNLVDLRWVMIQVAALYGVVMPALAGGFRKLRVASPSLHLLPWFVLIIGLQIRLADPFAIEVNELLLGVVFLFDVFERFDRGPSPGPSWAAPVTVAAALAGAAVLTPAAERVSSRSELVPAAREELRELQEKLLGPGVLQPSLVTSSRIHKSLRHAVERNYLELAPEGHYLDPWSQPYWFLYGRLGNDGLILVYSLGPNRKRDSDVTELISLQAPISEILSGDDIGMIIAIRDL
jgi:hypothetical protein